MKVERKQIIAAAIVFAATSTAFAQQTYPYVDFSGFQSTKTRSQVIAQLKEAKAEGLMSYRDGNYPVNVPVAASSLTREKVRADEIEWAKSHPHRQAGVNDVYFG
jgi:deoxyribose-phosphate aldolase